MDKVAPSKLTLAQQDEEKKEESGEEKAEESTTSTPTVESGSTDTSNVEGVFRTTSDTLQSEPSRQSGGPTRRIDPAGDGRLQRQQ